MSKKLVALVICMLGVFSFVHAQYESKIVVKGTIVNAQTGEPVSFTNLGVLGTVLGVASDMDGKFELVIPYKCAAHTLRFSAIGFRSFDMKVYEAQDKPNLQIKMEPIVYSIQEVNVYGELLVYKKMLRNVVDNIDENYISKPFNYEGYFKYVTTRNEVEKTKEAVVTIYDAEGYRRSDPETVFKNISYKYNQVRRSEEPESVLDGLTALDDIL